MTDVAAAASPVSQPHEDPQQDASPPSWEATANSAYFLLTRSLRSSLMRNKPPRPSRERSPRLRHGEPPIRLRCRGGASTRATGEPPEPSARAKLPPAIRPS